MRDYEEELFVTLLAIVLAIICFNLWMDVASYKVRSVTSDTQDMEYVRPIN